MGFRVLNGVLYPVGSFTQPNETINKNTVNKQPNNNFSSILNDAINNKESFVISKHAADRLKDVELTADDMKNINSAINKAEEKGSENCLILYRNAALITSIRNRTIITAIEEERVKENVFTNIDSVVVL